MAMERIPFLVTAALAFAHFASCQVVKDDRTDLMRTAAIIDVLPEISQIDALTRSRSDTADILRVRQRILEKVLAASLQVDATIAQIDNEIARSNEVRGYLADKRDKSVNRANLLSIIAGGALGGTSAGLQLPSGENKA